MNAATTIRELGPEEISLVGGGEGDYYQELLAVMLTGGAIGALAAGASTAGIGILPGFVSGALIAGTSYAVKECIEWLIAAYWPS